MEGPLELQRVHSRENCLGLAHFCMESESKLLFSPPQLTFLAFDIVRSLFGWNGRVCVKVTHGQVSLLSGTFIQEACNLSWQMETYHVHRKFISPNPNLNLWFLKPVLLQTLGKMAYFPPNNPCTASSNLPGFKFRLHSLLAV